MTDDEATIPMADAETLDAGLAATTPRGARSGIGHARRVVGSRYRIERELGRGGMGSVFLATDLELDEKVAVKLLHPRLVEDPRAAMLFRREVKLARRITHPNVARTFELHTGETAPFLTMEYVEGHDLAEVVGDRAVSPRKAFEYLLPVLDGLDAAHAAGVAHRDLKPTNILVGADGRVVVTDFGIATTAQSDGGEMTGTPAYLAPEQAVGRAVDGRTDLYALGVMLWEMLMGELPWVAPTAVAAVLRRLTEEPPPLSGSIQPDVARLVVRLMAREPRDRPSSAREVRDDIDRILAGTEAGRTAGRTYNLRLSGDGFVGRADELALMDEALATESTLLLVGPAGVGKTRLAEEFARAQLARFVDGAVVADLKEATNRADILRATSSALELPMSGDPAGQVGNILRATRTLIVLDGGDGAISGLSELVRDWSGVGGSRVVATLRRRAGIAGTHEIEVGPLPEGQAAELLRQRCSEQVIPIPCEDDALAIVKSVDCSPLAVQIAAARLRSQEAAQLLANLRGRASPLTGAGALGTMLDETWEQLGGALQRALFQATVVKGGATLAALCQIIDVGDEMWPEEALEALWEAFVVDWNRESDRLRLSQSMRDYALAKLDSDGAREVAEAQRRHAATYAELARSLVGDVAHAQALPAVEYDNFAAALRHLLVVGDFDAAVDCLRACRAVAEPLGWYQTLLGLCDEFDEAARLAGTQTPALAWSALHRAEALWGLGQRPEAERVAADALVAPSPPLAELGLLRLQADGLEQRGRLAQAEEAVQRRLELARERQLPREEGGALMGMGNLRWMQGEFHEAAELHGRARDISSLHGAWSLVGAAQFNLGNLAAEAGDYDAAIAYIEEARAKLTGRRDRLEIAANLGYFYRRSGRLEEARELLESGLSESLRLGTRDLTGVLRTNLGAVLTRLGRPDEAIEHLESALRIHADVGDKRFQGLTWANLGEAHASTNPSAMREAFEQALFVLDDYWADLARTWFRLGRAEPDRARSLMALREAETIVRGRGITSAWVGELEDLLGDLTAADG